MRQIKWVSAQVAVLLVLLSLNLSVAMATNELTVDHPVTYTAEALHAETDFTFIPGRTGWFIFTEISNQGDSTISIYKGTTKINCISSLGHESYRLVSGEVYTVKHQAGVYWEEPYSLAVSEVPSAIFTDTEGSSYTTVQDLLYILTFRPGTTGYYKLAQWDLSGVGDIYNSDYERLSLSGLLSNTSNWKELFVASEEYYLVSKEYYSGNTYAIEASAIFAAHFDFVDLAAGSNTTLCFEEKPIVFAEFTLAVNGNYTFEADAGEENLFLAIEIFDESSNVVGGNYDALSSIDLASNMRASCDLLAGTQYLIAFYGAGFSTDGEFSSRMQVIWGFWMCHGMRGMPMQPIGRPPAEWFKAPVTKAFLPTGTSLVRKSR